MKRTTWLLLGSLLGVLGCTEDQAASRSAALESCGEDLFACAAAGDDGCAEALAECLPDDVQGDECLVVYGGCEEACGHQDPAECGEVVDVCSGEIPPTPGDDCDTLVARCVEDTSDIDGCSFLGRACYGEEEPEISSPEDAVAFCAEQLQACVGGDLGDMGPWAPPPPDAWGDEDGGPRDEAPPPGDERGPYDDHDESGDGDEPKDEDAWAYDGADGEPPRDPEHDGHEGPGGGFDGPGGYSGCEDPSLVDPCLAQFDACLIDFGVSPEPYPYPEPEPFPYPGPMDECSYGLTSCLEGVEAPEDADKCFEEHAYCSGDMLPPPPPPTPGDECFAALDLCLETVSNEEEAAACFEEHQTCFEARSDEPAEDGDDRPDDAPF